MKVPLEVVLYGIGFACAIAALLCELRAIRKRKQQSVDDRLAESIHLYLLQQPEPEEEPPTEPLWKQEIRAILEKSDVI